MKTYKCKTCGMEFDVKEGQKPVCPMCGASGENVEEVKSCVCKMPDSKDAKANSKEECGCDVTNGGKEKR